MKIVATQGIDQGILATFNKISDMIVWMPDKVPVYDMLQTISPNLVLIETKYITKLIIDALKDFNTQVIAFGNGLPKDFAPTLLCASAGLNEKIKQNLISDDYKTIFLADSANIIEIMKGELRPIFKADMTHITNGQIASKEYYEYLQMFTELNRKVKLFGSIKVNSVKYVGSIQPFHYKDILASTKIFFDIGSNWLLNCAANKCFAISTISNSLFPSTTSQNAKSVILKYLKDDRLRQTIASIAYDKIMKDSTCVHRVCEICRAINNQDLELEARKLL